MSEMNVSDAISRVLALVRPMVDSRDMREIDSLLANIHTEYKAKFIQANSVEKDGVIVTDSGEILALTMDKAMNHILSFYGLSLQDVKGQIDELNEEGLSPVETIILPRPKLLGCNIEFDDIEFPTFE